MVQAYMRFMHKRLADTYTFIEGPPAHKGFLLKILLYRFSCKSNSVERMRQLRVVMKKMSKAPDDVTVLFGGDTNLRDYEVATVGIPSNVCDLWEQLGRPEKCRYTWDTVANTNKEIPFKCHFRFDRVYLRRATQDGIPQLDPDNMALIGLEKLRCGLFTSDHWGIYCTFSVKQK
ncbi:Tyrosyl-DNA phosphodiesterase 2 [Xenoophorus captivus]|uniref:Tyrosyl-DNA phosphodiesterase 2 n=1 Tax=Xenoophorus captivus TaxID=1517983 RepID=A0ABV0R437_9TELE